MENNEYCLAYECLVSEVDADCRWLCDLLGDQCESCACFCSLSPSSAD